MNKKIIKTAAVFLTALSLVGCSAKTDTENANTNEGKDSVEISLEELSAKYVTSDG